MKIICLLMILITTACAEETIVDTNVINVASSGEPVSLDPYDQLDGYSLQVRAQIYDPLLIRNEDGTFSPSLAISWEFISPQQVRFTLRDDVYFHNGDKFTSKDVKYTIERQKTSIPNRELYEVIEKVDALESEVMIYLKRPFAPFLAHMSLPNMFVVNQRAIESFGEERTSQAVGTGPYMLERWDRGHQVTLKAFDQYYKGAPSIKTMILKVVPDESSRSIVMETGEMQVIRELAYVDYDRISEDERFEVLKFATPNITYMSLNTKKDFMSDLRVRKALTLAIDREGMIQSVYFGQGRPTGSLVPFNAFGYTNIAWEQDKEKARALIQEAGVKGKSLKMYILGYQVRIAEIIQNNLSEIGLDLEINILEPGTFFQLIQGNEHHLYLTGWTTLTSDADYALTQIITSTGSWNNTGYRNAEVDDAIAKARYELNEAKRLELYAFVQKKLAEDIPVIPVLTTYGLNAKDKNVENIQVVGGSSVLYLGNVRYKQ